MTITEQKIGGYTGINIPGVLSLYLIDRDDVWSVQDPYRHVIPDAAVSRIQSGAIVLKTGAVVTKMKFPPLACHFSQVADRGDGGNSFALAVDFAIPSSKEEIFDYYHQNRQKQFVCLMEDANRQGYVLGNEERGLRMNIAQSIAAANAISVTFSAKLNVPAFLMQTSVNGLVLAEQFPDTEFGIEFSLDFNA